MAHFYCDRTSLKWLNFRLSNTQIIENLTVGHTDSKAKQKWERFVTYIQNNGKYHRDYRNLLKALGKKTSTYQPMGGSEATMRLFARRIKSGGYSWSIPGVNAMIQVLISLKTTGRIPGERETEIGEINQIEQNRKAHAKELISRSVHISSEYIAYAPHAPSTKRA